MQSHRPVLLTEHAGNRAGVEAQLPKRAGHQVPQTLESQSSGHGTEVQEQQSLERR
jgi:hypothetical protein